MDKNWLWTIYHRHCRKGVVKMVIGFVALAITCIIHAVEIDLLRQRVKKLEDKGEEKTCKNCHFFFDYPDDPMCPCKSCDNLSNWEFEDWSKGVTREVEDGKID